MRTRSSTYQLLCVVAALAVVLSGRATAQDPGIDNIDSLEPVVRESPVKDEPGEPHDFWGWSAVLHYLQQEVADETLQERAGKTR